MVRKTCDTAITIDVLSEEGITTKPESLIVALMQFSRKVLDLLSTCADEK